MTKISGTFCHISTSQNNIFSFSFSDCGNFTDRIKIPIAAEFVIVKCKNNTNSGNFYKNSYFLIQEKEVVKKRFASYPPTPGQRIPSIMILGLDSVGRLNLQRTMPKVVKFLKNNQFYDFKGYNKVGDNTYPNVLAAFAGLSFEASTGMNCTPKIVGGLDNCPLIWKDFQRRGYVTAYTEDYGPYSTFNYLKKGFQQKPVDYYGRPGTIMLEDNIASLYDMLLGYCAGARYIPEYIYSQAVDFADFYKGKPYFGLFWTNSLTHNKVADMLLMENILLDSLQQAKSRGILNDSIVIVMSDHGHRFPPSVKLASGWYDVRLPIMYISLPEWFRREYPYAATSLGNNQNRLTSPYDFYLTLKDILRKSGRVFKGTDNAYSCPRCQSLFKPVPLNRTCAQAGISDVWCTCQSFSPITKSGLAISVAHFLVSEINNLVELRLKKFNLPLNSCLPLSLKKINRAAEDGYNTSLINLDTQPGDANYEALVRYEEYRGEWSFKVEGVITRNTMYKNHAFCVKDLQLKKFCECSRPHKEE